MSRAEFRTESQQKRILENQAKRRHTRNYHTTDNRWRRCLTCNKRIPKKDPQWRTLCKDCDPVKTVF